MADRIRAAEIILDRLHGKPTQPIQQVPRVDVSGLSPEERIRDKLKHRNGHLAATAIAPGG